MLDRNAHIASPGLTWVALGNQPTCDAAWSLAIEKTFGICDKKRADPSPYQFQYHRTSSVDPPRKRNGSNSDAALCPGYETFRILRALLTLITAGTRK